MGVVYLGYDPHLDRELAVKVLPPAFTKDQRRVRRFLSEAKSAAQLDHTNTVTVFDAGFEDGLLFIAMQYIQGDSLDKLVGTGSPMPWRDAARAIRAAAQGLAAAHAKGLVHRDVKPANVMLTRQGVVKVVDFGLARSQWTPTHGSQDAKVLGTPAYMSPEQWKREPIDARSDIYSLACTFYTLLTGEQPFAGAAPASLGSLHCHQPLADPRKFAPGLPDAVCRVLGRGLQKRPDQRYQCVEELIAELDALLNLSDDAVTRTTTWETCCQMTVAGAPSPPGVPSPRPRHGWSRWAESALAMVRWLRSLDEKLRPDPPRKPTSAQKAGTPRGSRPALQRSRRIVYLLCAAAVVLFVLVSVYLSTNRGRVMIELPDVESDVEIRINGEAIPLADLQKPVRLRTGKHELQLIRNGHEPVVRSFTVKRGRLETVLVTEGTSGSQPAPETVVETRQIPAPAGNPPPSDPPKNVGSPSPDRQGPGVCLVETVPADADLEVHRRGIPVSGYEVKVTRTEGGHRVEMPYPDGTAILLIASKTGYETLQQTIRPQAGETSELVLELRRLPKPLRLLPIAARTIKPGEPLELQCEVEESAERWANRLAFSLVSSPEGAKIDPPSGRFSWVAENVVTSKTYEVTVAVLASDGQRDQVSFTVTVEAPPRVPWKTYSFPLAYGKQVEMVLVPAGAFMMGSTDDDPHADDDERPQHLVRIKQPFFLAKYELTRAQWLSVMNDLPGRFVRDDTHPVTNVSWDRCQSFLQRLNESERNREEKYRMPTEAEWEYACRAHKPDWRRPRGQKPSAWCFGDNRYHLTRYAWYSGNSELKTHPVGRKMANAFGLYDMHGNVAEWCEDRYAPYSATPLARPTNAGLRGLRVLRGGSYDVGPLYVRSARRDCAEQSHEDEYIGFRLARNCLTPIQGSAAPASAANPR
jgi:formylglycine-generating enzyme required for sulfatase activity/serine/threonine protein kinase